VGMALSSIRIYLRNSMYKQTMGVAHERTVYDSYKYIIIKGSGSK